jgi:hypothetical protein
MFTEHQAYDLLENISPRMCANTDSQLPLGSRLPRVLNMWLESEFVCKLYDILIRQ